MKTIAVANQKGGIGKTTVARHLMFYAMDAGLRVLGVDLDIQGNFTTSFQNIRNANGLELPSSYLSASGLFEAGNNEQPIICGKGLSLVPANPEILITERSDLETVIRAGQAKFAQLADDYDICVIDTGPSVSNLLIVALSVADFAVSPCKPDRDAIAGLVAFFSNVNRVKTEGNLNPNLAPLGVLPNQVNQKRAYHRDVLEEMKGAWGDGVLPVTLYERAAIDLAKDRAVWLTDKGESRNVAAKEMKLACSHIFERMGL